ncbi:MAG: thioredoxin [Patescibacteria group bacterium]|jgi:thiol-disulfide isomerase/thioredoxin|nr:thioredoxin [Patescibacteria group bacterium]
MKKIPVLAVTLIGLATLFFIFQNKDQNRPNDNQETPSPTAIIQSSPETAGSTASPSTASAGSYLNYEAGIIEKTSGTKVLFFHAPWCPQCRALEASIKEGTIPAGTTIIKVDYDSNQALRRTYGITLQTTLVRVSDSGDLIKKYVAYDEPTLENLVKNVL